jgi:hypothetical protein
LPAALQTADHVPRFESLLSTSTQDRVVLVSPINDPATPVTVPYATDLLGRTIWYLDAFDEVFTGLTRPGDAGTFLVTASGDVIREVDLVGSVVRETNISAINMQLRARGQAPMTSFHHDLRRLPNARTAVIASAEKILTDVQGAGAVNVLGDYVLVLDENWQLEWVWDSFEKLDPTRLATLGETCVPDQPGCPPRDVGEANDWTHSNAIAYSPADGHLILSIRSQDWVVKLDYADGAGSGDVLWRLGPDGDFDIASADPFPWFTHQHDSSYSQPGLLTVFDNGNVRCLGRPPGECNSRGQVYALDEINMRAYPVMNTDLGGMSPALGSAQRLSNGNVFFGNGFLDDNGQRTSLATEIGPAGTAVYGMFVGGPVYRTYRLPGLDSLPEGGG